MNKSKIEWTDYTWNPVTGCLHGCDYCYARRIANRFCRGTGKDDKKIHEVNNKMYDEWIIKEGEYGHRQDPYPYGFEPTFHRYRLNEPAKVKKPSKIFVSSMGDLFGDWVPDSWIEEVYMACQKAYWHKYMFLTKNPKKYSVIYKSILDYRCNMWFGTTVTNNDDMNKRGLALFHSTGTNSERAANRFLSIEPLLGEIDTWLLKNIQFFKWIIVGQQTGPGAVPPKPEWVADILNQCHKAGVPVFIKPPLYNFESMGLKPFAIQQWPEGLK